MQNLYKFSFEHLHPTGPHDILRPVFPNSECFLFVAFLTSYNESFQLVNLDVFCLEELSPDGEGTFAVDFSVSLEDELNRV